MTAARSARPRLLDRGALQAPQDLVLVDADVELPAERGGDDGAPDELVSCEAAKAANHAAKAIEALMLSGPNLDRARRARVEFAGSEDGSEVGEQLLHELVAGETAIALQVMDVEGALAALLTKTVTNPAVAMEVARVFREATALSGAIRRRIEGSLNAAAALKAQRVLLAAQRGRLGV